MDKKRDEDEKKALSVTQQRFEALAEEGLLCKQFGAYDAALALFLHALSLRPNNVEVHWHVGSCRRRLRQELLACGLLHKQIRLYLQARRISNLDHPDVHFLPVATRVPLLLLERERLLCWQALNDDEHAKQSQRNLQKIMGANRFQCLLAVADAYTDCAQYVCFSRVIDCPSAVSYAYTHRAFSPPPSCCMGQPVF